MKEIFRKIGGFLLATVMIFSILPQEVYAATNECILLKGDAGECNYWTTFIVRTGRNWGSNKITFKQTKGTMEYKNHALGGSKKLYGAYTLKVNDGSGEKTYYWKYKETYSLSLKDNTTYTIKIKPYQPKTVGEQNYKSFNNAKLHKKLGLLDMASWSWSSVPTWKVTSTKAVDWCQSIN